jgi:hypothetical protein
MAQKDMSKAANEAAKLAKKGNIKKTTKKK